MKNQIQILYRHLLFDWNHWACNEWVLLTEICNLCSKSFQKVCWQKITLQQLLSGWEKSTIQLNVLVILYYSIRRRQNSDGILVCSRIATSGKLAQLVAHEGHWSRKPRSRKPRKYLNWCIQQPWASYKKRASICCFKRSAIHCKDGPRLPTCSVETLSVNSKPDPFPKSINTSKSRGYLRRTTTLGTGA